VSLHPDIKLDDAIGFLNDQSLDFEDRVALNVFVKAEVAKIQARIEFLEMALNQACLLGEFVSLDEMGVGYQWSGFRWTCDPESKIKTNQVPELYAYLKDKENKNG
jgi:hypothetical protein